MDVWRHRRRKSNKTHRHWLWRNRRRDCFCCGTRLTLRPNCENTLTVDHAVPLSRGGKNKRHNYVPACEPCNMEKGDMTAAEFIQYRSSKQCA